jgi:hypothetical protein
VGVDFCWFWWNCWPSLNELRWYVIFVDIGGIFAHPSMNSRERWFLLILVELLTITQWINKNHLSPKIIEWWLTIPPISTKITSHFNSLNDGQQFHQYQQTSPLTRTHSVMVNNSSTNINKKSPLYSTHWVMVNNSTNINKNYLSPPFIVWPSLNELRWEVIFVDIGGIVDHHSMSWIEGWFFVDIGGGIVDHHWMSWSERWCLLILVELLTIIQWVEVRCDFGWYWWNC